MPLLHIAPAAEIMPGSDYLQDRLPPGGPAALLACVAPGRYHLRQSGRRVDGAGAPARQREDALSCYLFPSLTAYAGVLCDAGFSVLNLANNDARDFGEEGWVSSTQALTRTGIHLLIAYCLGNFCTYQGINIAGI